MPPTPDALAAKRLGPARSLGPARTRPHGFKDPKDLKNKSDYSGKPAKVMDAEAAVIRDAQVIVTRCLYCGWEHDGPAVDGRAAARAHREERHPEAVGRKTMRRRNFARRPDLKPDEDVILENNRVRAEREEAVRLATIARGRARRLAQESV